jgi:glycosidase
VNRYLPPGRARWIARGGLLGILIVTGAVLLLSRDGPGPGPIAQQPDKPPLAIDGTISDADLAHDSRNDLYRVPFGAVPAGTVVTLRLQAAAGDLSEASVRVYDALAQTQVVIDMEVVARDATAGEHGYDYWQVELPTIKIPTVLYYRFILRDGAATRYLEDDSALDGGAGSVLAQSADASWQIVTYDPEFAAPGWTAGATVYQIFPDRFANGDPSNDPSPGAVPGPNGAEHYRYGDVYGNPVLVKAWGDLPEGYCRAYQSPAEPCTEGPLGRDFFGGDLAGLTEHLPDLADLGVTVIYLNPIFAAPSNHRYDTTDYAFVDPDLGTNEEFDDLVATAHDLGMSVILDGVFNHTSSDSPFFDRAHRFSEVGACESADSPHAAWYTLQPGPPAKCFDGQTYVDWFGFDTLPVLTEGPEVMELINGDDGVVRSWLAVGIDGWRLDVMNEIGHGFLRALRRAAKEASPDSLVLGEEWGDASAWLLGGEADGVMNYRFRRAVIGLVNGDTPDLDGSIAGMTPSQFASAMEGVREDYPPAAWNSLLNLVDSHDTTRILWTLTPGADNREEKEAAEALDAGKAKLRQVAALQLTWPGMASIYYGDEVGLTGHDDPDDRRTYPWGAEDTELRAFYRSLATLRRGHEALRSGDLRFLETDDQAGVLAFGRRTDAEAVITVLNLSETERPIEIEVGGYLPDGLAITDVLGGEPATWADGVLRLTLAPRGIAVLLSEVGSDLAPPDAPAGISATATAGSVTLSWDASADAVQYTVWRSVVAGGGYLAIGGGSATTYADVTARNGTQYHYVVTASDAADNASARSADAAALPQVTVADARLTGASTMAQPLSAVDAGAPVTARITVDGYSGATGATIGVLAQAGLGPGGTDPATDEAWRWSPMTFNADVDSADEFVGSVRPEEVGSYEIALRVSTDGGASWQLADRDGIGYAAAQAVLLEAQPPADEDPPGAPADAAASVVSEASVTLVWSVVDGDDLFRYEVWRADEPGGPYQRIGTASDATFTDQGVRGGASYYYVVTAQDTSFNRSDDSNEVVAAAESRTVAVTFNATIPANTPAGDTVYIAGAFQGWDPGATPMTAAGGGVWTITVEFAEGEMPEFKFTRGSWDAVEKDAGCGEIPNRTFTVVHGTEGSQLVEATVEKWRNIDHCG